MRIRRLNLVERYACLIVLAVCLAGCAGMGGSARTDEKAAEGKNTNPVIPANLQERIRLSEVLGEALYISNKMAAIGTDVMLQNVKDPKKTGICGHIVFSETNDRNVPTGSWIVEFFRDAANPKVGYQVRLTPPPAGGPVARDFRAYTPPRKPSDRELLLHRAIRKALEAVPDKPDQPFSPVVMPAALLGEDGILVYLLAGTRQENVAVFGTHYRVLVSLDGRSVYKVESLSRSGLEIPLDNSPKDGSKAAIQVAHQSVDTPLETDVFVSLLHNTDVVVQAGKYTWLIHEGKIRLQSMRN